MCRIAARSIVDLRWRNCLSSPLWVLQCIPFGYGGIPGSDAADRSWDFVFP